MQLHLELSPGHEVTVVAETTTVIQSVSPKLEVLLTPIGSKGDPGVKGDTGGRFEHSQGTAADVWVINHNLGYRPSVSVLSVGGVTMLAEVLHTSFNQVLVYFDRPETGLAICS